jgi:hypothetical protein
VIRIDDPAALLGPQAGCEIDPINALVLGESGTLPPAVQLASQKIPADPAPSPEVISAPAPVPMKIEEGGMQGPEPIEIQPMNFFNRWLAGPRKVDGVDDRGIGYERVATAPFVIDITQPMNQWAFRIDAAYHWKYPDEADYFFARPTSLGGKGPAAETSADYQDYTFISEMGNSSASARLALPVRQIDGDINGDTAGMGDIQLTTKVVLLTGERLKITQFLDTYVPTGAAGKGLGTGHVSMEPGFLASYRWSDETFFHAEAKYLIPIPTSPGEAGTILTWGFGMSHLLYDGDLFAVIPTAELVCYTIFNASETSALPVPTIQTVEHEVIPTLHFGVRVVSDRFRDIGTVEFGLSTGFNLGASGWYEELLRTEIRVLY